MLFQGALCQCVSLHPEVSNEGEVRGDGGSGHQRDARRGGQECESEGFRAVQGRSREDGRRRGLSTSLHPPRCLGLSHSRLFQLGCRGRWTGHPSNNTMASGQHWPHRDEELTCTKTWCSFTHCNALWVKPKLSTVYHGTTAYLNLPLPKHANFDSII